MPSLDPGGSRRLDRRGDRTGAGDDLSPHQARGRGDRACSGSMTRETMPRIRSLQVRAVRVPMAHPHKTAGGTVEESPLVLIDIATEDGTVGHGVVFTYTAAALRPTAELVRNLEPLVV